MPKNPLFERARCFLSVLRHHRVLRLTVEATDEGGLTLRLPYSQTIIDNPENGVVHGSVVTILMDTTCGISAVCMLSDFEICPTLDLYIDYMHPAGPHKGIYGFVGYYQATPNTILTRGFAYQDDPG